MNDSEKNFWYWVLVAIIFIGTTLLIYNYVSEPTEVNYYEPSTIEVNLK